MSSCLGTREQPSLEKNELPSSHPSAGEGARSPFLPKRHPRIAQSTPSRSLSNWLLVGDALHSNPQPPRGHCPERGDLTLSSPLLGRIQPPHLDRSISSPVYVPEPAALWQKVNLSLSQPSGSRVPAAGGKEGDLSWPKLASSLQRTPDSSAKGSA